MVRAGSRMPASRQTSPARFFATGGRGGRREASYRRRSACSGPKRRGELGNPGGNGGSSGGEGNENERGRWGNGSGRASWSGWCPLPPGGTAWRARQRHGSRGMAPVPSLRVTQSLPCTQHFRLATFKCSNLICRNFYLRNLLVILYVCKFTQDEAVQKVVEFMDTYCLSQEDFDTLVELSKFKVGGYSKSCFMFRPYDGMH